MKYGIGELYFDTEKGLDIDDAPSKQEAQQELQTELDQLASFSTGHQDTATVGVEIVRAKQLIGEAKRATKKLMHDVKLG